jgi:two-component system NtrC family sensor kinase
MDKIHNTSRKYQYQLAVLVFLILITILLNIISFLYVKSINNNLLEKIHTIQIKLEIFDQMRDIASDRLEIIQSSIINEDPFIRDDMLIEHSQLGHNFFALMTKLNKLKVLEVKQSQFEQMMKAVSTSSDIQNKIKALVDSEELADARELASSENTILAKKNLLIQIDKIRAHYNLLLSRQISETNTVTIKNFQFIILLVVLILFAILFFGIRIIKNIWSSDMLLRKEIEERTKAQSELQIYQHTLEKIVEERNSALIKSEARTQAIVDKSPVAILSMDTDGKIISFNPHAESIFGYKQSEILGKSMTTLIPKEFHQQHNDGLQRYVETGKSTILNKLIEVNALHQSGKIFPIELRVNVMKHDNETFFTGMINDVSEQKALHSQLLQAQKLESVGQLAAGIAHEINTPMQYITDNTVFIKEAYEDIQQVLQLSNNLCQSVQENNSDQQSILTDLQSLKKEIDIEFLLQELPTTLEQTLEGLQQISNIISAMKSFSHPSNENKTTAHLNTIIQNTITISRNEWKYSADIETKFDDSLEAIQLYPDLIGQVLLNIIVNSACAISNKQQSNDKTLETEQKGIIIVATSLIESYQVIEVIDNGGGISDDIKEKVFDPFFTTKDVGKGTGQGLSMAYSIITEKHNGKLEFENNDLGGTTFKIFLPM